MVVERSSSSSQPYVPVMEPVLDNEGVASSGTPVDVAHTRPTTTRPVIANSLCVEVSDILSVPAVHSSSHSFDLRNVAGVPENVQYVLACHCI